MWRPLRLPGAFYAGALVGAAGGVTALAWRLTDGGPGGAGAAGVGRRRGSGGRGGVPGREPPRRHGGPSHRALRALGLGGGTNRRRPRLAGGEAGGRAGGSPCTRGGRVFAARYTATPAG